MDNTLSWVKKHQRICPVTGIVLERVRFDTQELQNPDIACKACNQDSKKNLQPEDWISFLSKSPKKIDQVRLQNATKFLEGKRPSLATAAENTTRNALFFELRDLGLLVECSTGGRTKYNRSRLNIPKTHFLDAACTGQLYTAMGWQQNALLIKAMGRGSYQRTRVDKYGFFRGTLMAQKTVKGFATGVMLKAKVSSGKKKGIYIGKVAVRKSGSFNIQTKSETVQGISWKCYKIISRQSGYNCASQVSSPT